jgi:Raf kinase inhibitor-like YbhB/YbcL family protein
MRVAVAVGVVVVAALGAGCAGTGGSASPGGTAPASAAAVVSPTPPASPATVGPVATPSTEPTAIVEETPMPDFTLTSTAFEPRADIPERYTCDGADVSPPLAWSSAPRGTVSFVLMVHDPDARGFTHWLAYEIPGGSTGSLPEAIAANAPTPKQGRNDFGKIGYGGPCPPRGSGTHHYVFGLWAIDRSLGLAEGLKPAAIEAAMDGHILARTELVGLYKRH